jgi:tetratricopeptide (TPR) repeat protein
MNTLKTVLTLLLLMSLHLASAQGGNDRRDLKPLPPELLEKSKRAGEAEHRGRAFLEQKKYDEAIAAFREAIAIEATIPGFESSGNYELAKALVLAGRPEEALAAYKNAIEYREDWHELHINGPPFPYVQLDYAILLAKSGKVEEAKMIYYSVLRNYRGNRNSEPFPLLVVFDYDPTMVVWEYSPERFIAAAMMARATLSQNEAVSMAERVAIMEPNWVVPVVYLASRGKRSENLRIAQALAANDEEKAWVRMYTDAIALGGDVSEVNQRVRDVAASLAAIGVARRKASPVLQQAKLDLEQNWQKVAGGSSGSGAGPGGAGCSCTARVGLRAWIGG